MLAGAILQPGVLNEISNIHGHLLYLCIVEGLNITHANIAEVKKLIDTLSASGLNDLFCECSSRD